MLRLNSVTKLTSRLLFRPVAMAGIQKSLLDPSKHITMNHQPHREYIDQYDIGQYPEVILTGSVPSKAYEPKTIEIICQYLNKRYNANLQPSDIQNHRQKTWKRLLSKKLKTQDNYGTVLPGILLQLSRGLIIKESKFTWVTQQRQRLIFSNSYFLNIQCENIGDFLEQYSLVIHILNSYSRMGLSDIPQPPSPIERYEQSQRELSSCVGIADLKTDRPQNKKLINKLMNWLHSS